MLYTLTPAARQADRIVFYNNSSDAAAAVADAPCVFKVAVRFDRMNRRVVPLWADPESFDPAWTTPAQLHGDGSITARGPIPEPLFLE